MSAPVFAAFAFCVAGAFTMACNKISGLAKGDAGDGEQAGATSSRGIPSAFESFEGEITVQLTTKPGALDVPTSAKADVKIAQGPITLVVGIQSPKARVDLLSDVSPGRPMLGQGVALIIDPPAKKAYALITAQKNAIAIDFEKTMGIAEQLRAAANAPNHPATRGAPPAASEPPKIDKTSKKDTVAGYECEEWKITTKDTHVDVCMATGIRWIDLTNLSALSPEFALAAAASDGAHFPLRIAFFDEKGNLAMRAEATKIDKKKLDNAHFLVPPDFKVVDVSDMLGSAGMGGLPDGGTLGTPPRRAPRAVPHR